MSPDCSAVVDAPNRRKSDATMYGITRSLKRRAVADYQVAKNKQKLAEDVHKAMILVRATAQAGGTGPKLRAFVLPAATIGAIRGIRVSCSPEKSA